MEKEISYETMNNIAKKDTAIYSDDRIAFIEELQKFETYEPVKTGVIIIVLCLKGKASLYLDGEIFHLGINDLLICHPNIIVEQSMVSVDIEYRCICMSPEYVQQLGMISNNTWDVLHFLEKSPVLHLNPEEVSLFCQYYDLIRSKLTGKPCRHQKELVDALLQAFLYEFHDALERFVSITPPKFSSGEKLFKDFVTMLTTAYPKSRSVAAYADQLCITPKYLSAICKEFTGKPASDIIDKYVIKDIVYLLKKTDKSIKEICNELDFPNISFFGKYVKRAIGMSPKQYREKLRSQPASLLNQNGDLEEGCLEIDRKLLEIDKE